MADLGRAFFVCWQKYSIEGIPLDEETTTGVEFRGGSLIPLGSFIKQNPGYIKRPFIFVSAKTVQSYIRNQLTLQGVLDQNGSFAAPCFPYRTMYPC
ncbi:hypothetical protein N7517_004744 [Penicillium concentricum]|uniref:Uncharacterized protein n=1 Tax=Penicillium concentricum TaxID=293559 RepID=A0A9W9S635_9EURO|nr:uncharacterized protein N7517_004744 [Penicillium concentricum]KAJ5372738.1 hypothetical protein N7517_004744 [Penicillium concentricum]